MQYCWSIKIAVNNNEHLVGMTWGPNPMKAAQSLHPSPWSCRQTSEFVETNKKNNDKTNK